MILATLKRKPAGLLSVRAADRRRGSTVNAEVFAEWMRRRRCRVFRTSSSYWYEAGPHVLQAFPHHLVISPTDQETRQLMVRHGIVALRYSTPVDSPAGMLSYHVVLEPPYELGMLKSQARNGVKRGLAHFNIERISFERLATEGWELQRDTLERQNRLRSMTRKQWTRLCRSAEGLPGFEVWAAIAPEGPAAALIITRIDDVFEVPYAMSGSRFLGDHVNNALFYSVSREMLGREGIRGVFFTVQPLDAADTVDQFKLRMGFVQKAVRQRIGLHPLLKSLATERTRACIQKWAQHDPGNPLLTKAEGMLRFHLEGRPQFNKHGLPVQDDACTIHSRFGMPRLKRK